MDKKELSLEEKDYSVDTESTMGYYCYDQENSPIPYVERFHILSVY